MAFAPVSATPSAAQPGAAFGLDFQSLLKIILTQLQFQDPLKPLDNFQFVSQLAEFAQLQQSQSISDQLTSLVSAQATNQAVGLLGTTVDFNVAATRSSQSGVVKSVSFTSNTPQLTILTANGQTLAGVSLADVTQIR